MTTKTIVTTLRSMQKALSPPFLLISIEIRSDALTADCPRYPLIVTRSLLETRMRG